MANSNESSKTQKKLDTISRQAAIRWVKTECNPYGNPTLDFESGKKVMEHLERMPSAQPEQPSEIQDILNYLDTVLHPIISPEHWNIYSELYDMISTLPTAELPDTNVGDIISRQAAIDALGYCQTYLFDLSDKDKKISLEDAEYAIERMPSAEPKQRYTEEELSVFAHGISLSLLSKRSAQHWQYDEDTATEIKFLERLYEKVGADIRGEEV